MGGIFCLFLLCHRPFFHPRQLGGDKHPVVAVASEHFIYIAKLCIGISLIVFIRGV